MILMSEKQMTDFSIYETAGKALRQSEKNKKMIRAVLNYLLANDKEFRQYMRGVKKHEKAESKKK